MDSLDQPKVSVGMPVHNGAPYIEMAIKSILNQSYKNIELIISDNASTDSTQEMCEAFARKDPRIKYFRLQDNKGVVFNFRNVFNHATGKYFTWATADDVRHPHFAETLVDVLENNQDVVLAFSSVQRIDDSGDLIGEPLKNHIGKSSASALRRIKKNLLIMSGSMMYGLIRSDVLRKTVVFPDKEIGTNSDAGILTELSAYGRFYVVKMPLFFRRKHKKQLNRTRKDSYWADNRWFINEPTREWIRSFPLKQRAIDEIEKYMTVVIHKRLYPSNFRLWRKRFVRRIIKSIQNKLLVRKPTNISNVSDFFVSYDVRVK